MEEQTYLIHHGIQGQKWGVRRYQNADGSLTAAGKKRYYDSDGRLTQNRKARKEFRKMAYKDYKSTTKDSYKEGYTQFKKDSKDVISKYKSAKKGASKEKKQKLKEKMIRDLIKVEQNYNKTVNRTKKDLEKKYGKDGIKYLRKIRIQRKELLEEALSAAIGVAASQGAKAAGNSSKKNSPRYSVNNSSKTGIRYRYARAVGDDHWPEKRKYRVALTKYTKKYRNRKRYGD